MPAELWGTVPKVAIVLQSSAECLSGNIEFLSHTQTA